MSQINKILLVVSVIVAIAGLSVGGVAVYSKIRGIRNNNPLNIRRTADQWQGLAPENNDGEFFIFSEAKWGIRAAARIIDNYKKAGKKTIVEIINTWAPPSENDTTRYIDYVLNKTGFSATHVPNKADGDYVALLSAMIWMENGINPYTDNYIAQAVALA